MPRRPEIVARLASRTKPSTHLSTAPSPDPPPPSHPPSPTNTTPPTASPRPVYKIKASILLSRPPMLTRDLTPFEKSYFLYQKRLNERLAMPFSRYFYYQQGTPGDVAWKRSIRERLTPARDIGVYNAYAKEGWNDEVLVGAKESEPEVQVEALLRDAEVEGVKGEEGEEVKKLEVERPMPRVTEADRVGDRKSLDRLLQRTLYLVVREGEGGRWWFPNDLLVGKESLHTAAERIIVQTGGVNMNTWVVGNIPLGYHVHNYDRVAAKTKDDPDSIHGEKTFFMKGRIMAGQANLTDNKLGLTDFQWLAKEEIQKTLTLRDYNAVKNVLAER
ncbi:MAG: hypothetical protein Q9182_000453 [Xanthomendoza sp. 2 TL-2023]